VGGTLNGNLEMNQPAGGGLNTAAPIGYTPTAEEKAAIRLVNKCYDEAKRYRKRYDYKWLDYYHMFRGKQWKESRPSYRHAEVINMVFRSIQGSVPIMTDSRPRIEYLPQEPQDRQFAQIMNELVMSDWESQNWLYKLTEMVYDAHFYGTSLGSVLEPKKPGGRIQFNVEDPFYCFPDPDAINVNEKANYFVHAEPVSVSKLKREYPKYAKYIKSDLNELDLDRLEFDDTEDQYKSTINDRSLRDGAVPGNSRQPDKALKVTLYIHDDSYVEEESSEKDPVTGETKPVYIQKLKYPQGRKICIASGVVLHDGPMGYEDGNFPFSRLVNYIDPKKFWGISDVEQMESPQKIFNKLVSFALDVLTLMGNPIWKIPTSAGIDTDNIFNRPGLILEYDGDQPPMREEGVQLQPYVMNMIQLMSKSFEDVAGDAEVSRGVRPEGITAASAISQLQESAKTRIRLKVRNMDAYLQDFGQLYLSRVLQFYTAPQVFRLTGDQGAQQFFKFYVEDRQSADGEVQKVAVVRRYNEQGQEGMTQEIPVKGKLDVKVATGSSLPFAKDERVALANAAFDRGAIDQEELLKAYDYPNYQAVMERMVAKAEQQAQMQAQQPQGAK
jgi:hypothetical protein